MNTAGYMNAAPAYQNSGTPTPSYPYDAYVDELRQTIVVLEGYASELDQHLQRVSRPDEPTPATGPRVKPPAAPAFVALCELNERVALTNERLASILRRLDI